MRESRLSGSVEGVVSDHDSYSDSASGRCELETLVRRDSITLNVCFIVDKKAMPEAGEQSGYGAPVAESMRALPPVFSLWLCDDAASDASRRGRSCAACHGVNNNSGATVAEDGVVIVA
jgi:hypothetical protein